MYKYTNFYQNIPCGSSVISVFAICSLTAFGWTHTPIIVHTCGLCNVTDIGFVSNRILNSCCIHVIVIANKVGVNGNKRLSLSVRQCALTRLIETHVWIIVLLAIYKSDPLVTLKALLTRLFR